PAREAVFPGNGPLGLAQGGVGAAGAERVEAILAEFPEPFEVGAEGELSGHGDTFFRCARRPRLAGRKKVVGSVGPTGGVDPARGPSAGRHGRTRVYTTGTNRASVRSRAGPKRMARRADGGACDGIT